MHAPVKITSDFKKLTDPKRKSKVSGSPLWDLGLYSMERIKNFI